MSLVGTRPPTVDEWDKYELHHRARLATKPGLTGMWQVSGRSNITDFEEVVKLDKQYISEWTIWRRWVLYLAGQWRFYDRSRYQQWRYDCDPEAEYSFGWRHCCTLNTICSELEKENPQKNLLKTTIRSLDSFLSIANGKVIIYKYSRWYFTVFLGCSDPYSYSSCFL